MSDLRVIPARVTLNEGRHAGFVQRAFQGTRLILVLIPILALSSLLFSPRAGADARALSWSSFLEPVRRICVVQVVAARELLEERPAPIERSGAIYQRIEPPQMVSTVKTARSLNGECPPFAEVRWEVPIGFPAFILPLNEVRSWFLLFLGDPYEWEDDVPSFRISPQYAWPSRHGTTGDGEAVRYYETQYLLVPEALYTSYPLRWHVPRGYFVQHERVLTEEALFNHLRSIDLGLAPEQPVGHPPPAAEREERRP